MRKAAPEELQCRGREGHHEARGRTNDANSDAPLNVVIVTPKAFMGGAERWLLSLLENTSRLAPTVIALDAGALIDHLREAGIQACVLQTGNRPKDLLLTSLLLRRKLQELKPDVVLGSGIKAATVTLPLARALGIPSLWVEHEPSYRSTLGVAARWLADRTITVTPPAPDAEEHDDAVFIPPPLLAEPKSRALAREELQRAGVPDDGLFLLGMFCRLAPYKGVDTAIRSLAEPGSASWRLVLAAIPDPGAPDELDRLTALATELGVLERVSILGEVTGAGELAGACDAVAVLTRRGEPGWPDGEGYGMTLVEAQAAGVPVIADPRTVPPLRQAVVAAGCVAVDATSPQQVAAALSVTVGQTRDVLTLAATRAGNQHPRPSQVSDRLVAQMAEVAARPGAGMAMGPPMSIVVTVLNEREGIYTTVRGLVELCRDDDEVVVVDGGSTDGTLEILREWSDADRRVQVIHAPGTNISAGRNLGIGKSRAEWIACTDCGCEVAPQWLEALRAAAAEDRYDLVTGVYRAHEGQGQGWKRALAHVAYPSPEELRRRTPFVRAYGGLFGRTYDAALPTGRSVAFRRQLALDIGGFPEHLTTAEDVMFGQLAVQAGARCVLSVDAEVVWEQRSTLTANGRMFRGYGRGDGASGNPLLIGRNAVRAATILLGPMMLRRGPTRLVAAGAALAYLSLPMTRALRGDRPLTTMTLVPLVAAYRDWEKVRGCAEGLWRVWRKRRSNQ